MLLFLKPETLGNFKSYGLNNKVWLGGFTKCNKIDF